MKKATRQLVISLIIIIIVLLGVGICVAYLLWFRSAVENMDGGYGDNKKTIFLVWSDQEFHAPTGREMNHGLGDKMKGAIVLHQYCRDNNCKLIVDGSQSILNNYFANLSPHRKPLNPDDLLPDNLHIFGNWMGPEEFDMSMKELLKTHDEICVYFWTGVDKELLREAGPEDKAFIKHLFEPSDSIRDDLDKRKQSLPSDYGIRHYRFSDDIFASDVKINSQPTESWLDDLKKTYAPTDVLFTNSRKFKEFAKERVGIMTIDCDGSECDIQHSGMNLITDDASSKVKNTVMEFLLMNNAKYIYSKTVYGWCSNFVKWPAIIYDIPFKC
jgi:hypothetical protein